MYKNILVPISVAIALSSCVSNDNRENVQNVNTEVIEKDSLKQKVEQIKKVFYELPSPMELSMLFKEEGIEYQNEKLHPVEKKDIYTISFKKAFNLGVYGADLSYAGLFGKHEDALMYFSAAQLLADDLGIGQTFKKKYILRLEAYPNDRDTLLAVISDFFIENDHYLRDKQNENISTYVLAGGWIEGMHLGANMLAENTDREGILKVISGQRNSLHNLILMLTRLDDTRQVQHIINGIVELEKEFVNIPLTLNNTAVSVHSDTLAADNLALLTDSNVQIIKERIAEIRSMIVR
ncbi:MAG: hypothetical protein CMO34_01065 [Verrucomicrobia bacterium]|nr:hypothetical protein [Verrucomicrobiota bacterium]